MPQGVPMQQLSTRFQDDDGYVYTENPVLQSLRTSSVKKAAHSRKFSVDVMNQLPSRQLDDLIVGNISEEQDREQRGLCSTTLKRRESRYKTLRLQSATINSRHMQVDADKIYELLTADMEIDESEIKETLRDMYQSLTLKRIVKARFESEEERKNQFKQVHWQARLKYRIAMAWQQLKYSARDLKYSLELWHGHVKTIQGHFGSGVASYFIFLRWLLYLNTVIVILIISFIISPQFLYQAQINSSKEENNSVSFTGYDLVTGSGWLTDSVLYYGHYTNETIEFVDGLPYNMSLAYLLTIGVCIVIYLLTLAYSLKKSYQQNYIDTSGDMKNIFANKVFSSWDYTVETVDAARLRSRTIYIELKEILSTELKLHVEESWITKAFHTCVCITVNIFVVSIMCGIGYLVYYILDIRAVNTNIPVLKKLTLALTVSAISLVFPFLFSFIKKMEWFYSKETSFYITMIRVTLLKIIILGVLVYFWVILHDPNRGILSCFETDLGEEIYRLLIVNFIVTLFFYTILGEYLKRVLSKNCCMWLKHPEFNIIHNTLYLIDYQTLIWVGIFYSPMLPLLLLIIFVLLFYVKRYSVTVNCRPSLTPWYAAHAHTLFLALTFINFLLAAFVIGYIIFKISPSTGCGPFQLQKFYYGVLLALLGNRNESNLAIGIILKYATSPGIMAAVFTALCVAVYYSRSKAKAYEEIVQLIREQLILEGKDKVFLLKLFDSALQQKYQSTAANYAKPGPSHITDSFGIVEDCPVNNQKNKSELINQVYRDYSQHGCSKDSPKSQIVFQAKFVPVYIPADVPANNQPPENSRESFNQDSSKSKKRQNTMLVTDQFSASSMRENSVISEIQLQNFRPNETKHKNDCRSRNTSPTKFVQEDLTCGKGTRQSSVPLPVHQQGFQYLVRGETPPRINQIPTEVSHKFLRK